MKNLKIIIYDNDGDSDMTSSSLIGVSADIIMVDNNPKNIDNETMNGDHKIIILTDNRNSFHNQDCVTTLVRSVSDNSISCPVFTTAGCKEVFHPSVLDISGKDKPFRLSWNHSPAIGEDPREIGCAMGCCLAFKKEWISKIGGIIGVREPDNRDILISLLTKRYGGKCMSIPKSVVNRRFGGPSRPRDMGKEMLKMAFSCLSHYEFQGFLSRYVSKIKIEEMATEEELREWLEIRTRVDRLQC